MLSDSAISSRRRHKARRHGGDKPKSRGIARTWTFDSRSPTWLHGVSLLLACVWGLCRLTRLRLLFSYHRDKTSWVGHWVPSWFSWTAASWEPQLALNRCECENKDPWKTNKCKLEVLQLLGELLEYSHGTVHTKIPLGTRLKTLVLDWADRLQASTHSLANWTQNFSHCHYLWARICIRQAAWKYDGVERRDGSACHWRARIDLGQHAAPHFPLVSTFFYGRVFVFNPVSWSDNFPVIIHSLCIYAIRG